MPPMPPSPTTERLAVLVLIVAASVVVACERKNEQGGKSATHVPRQGNPLPPVVPALGIRG